MSGVKRKAPDSWLGFVVAVLVQRRARATGAAIACQFCVAAAIASTLRKTSFSILSSDAAKVSGSSPGFTGPLEEFRYETEASVACCRLFAFGGTTPV